MILHDVEKFIRKFVSYNDHESVVTTLWLAHAIIVQDMPEGICSPRLAILSPKKECGKSTLLEITGLLLSNSIASVNMSAAALYRTIEKSQPVIQLDEIDQKSLDDKLELIHGGFKKGKAATVHRCKDDGTLETFNVFGPLMYAGIDKGQMADTTSSRSIPIRMQPDPYVTPFRFRQYGPEILELQRQLKDWCDSIKDKADTFVPNLPKTIVGRTADKWEMLFIIAELADIVSTGNLGTPSTPYTPFLERLTMAVRFIEKRETDVLGELTDSETLIRDINEILKEYPKDTKRIHTKDIIYYISNENDKWKYYNGVGSNMNITGEQLRFFLRPYGIIPERNAFNIGTTKARGYTLDALRLSKTGVSGV